MNGTKTCIACGQELPVEAFYHHIKHKDGVASQCKQCHKKQSLARYHEVWKHDPAVMERRRQTGRAWYQANAKRANDRVARDHRAQREACIAEYGGVCECCGESRYEFLSLHHTNGDGDQHRRAVGNKVPRWLVANGFPKDIGIGVLCHNCNSALGYYGYCPHKRDAAG